MLAESVSPHPLAEQAQACGSLTQADGRRDHWLLHLLKKKKLDYISRFVHIILAPVHAVLLCIVPKKILELYLSSLRRDRANPLCVERHS